MATIAFRDGERVVPDYVADLLISLPVHALTYEQAIKQMNTSLLREHLKSIQAKTVADHLSTHGR